MKKIIIVLLLFLSSFTQSQDLRTVTIRPTKSWLVDSLLAGRYNVSLFTDYGFKILVNNSKKFQIDSTGIFNYFSGIHNFTNGGNVIFGTTDDYSLKLKTNDSTRIEITNRGNLVLPEYRKGIKYGYLYQGSYPLIHNYYGATGTSSYSQNTFVGVLAGNFTSNATASNSYLANLNTAVGYNALNSLTSGYSNVAIGYNCLSSITSGWDNIAIGQNSFPVSITNGNNVGIGSRTGQYNKGNWNLFMGNNAGSGPSSGTVTASYNVGMGYNSLTSITTGTFNLALATMSGNTLTTGVSNILIGDSTITTSPTASYELNIGRTLYGKYIKSDTARVGILTSNPNSTLQTESFATGFVNKTASYYATIHDYTINFTSGNDTLFLPNATQCIGRELVIKNSGTGNCYVVGIVSQTIDEAPAYNLPTKFDFVRVQSNGSNWIIVGKN